MAIALYPSLVDQLYNVDGKAEIVNGRIVPLMATGRMPARAAFKIAISLELHVERLALPGIVTSDNAGFIVQLPRRQSFSPDAAYYEGPDSGMKFFEGAPVLAIEVRSENDYGLAAENEMERKRRDYFAAGTSVVWDVDLLDDVVVRKFTAEGGSSQASANYSRGESADAEPALPGWLIAVNDLFDRPR